MSSSQVTQIIAAVATILSLAALVLLFMNYRGLKKLQRNQQVVLGSRGQTDIISHVGGLEGKMGNLRTAIEDLAVVVRDQDSRIDACVSRVALVRFDALDDLGGRQSASLAFLTAREDGIVVSSVVSRDFARIYVKSIRDGQPDVPLAPEEIEAFDRARAHAPFTIRPRPEPKRPAKEESVQEAESNEEIKAALRELERENRRRKRRGMAPLEELPPPPSALGWPKPAPASQPEGGADIGDDEPTLDGLTLDESSEPTLTEAEQWTSTSS